MKNFRGFQETESHVNMSLFYNLVFSQSVYSYYHNQRHCDNFSEEIFTEQSFCSATNSSVNAYHSLTLKDNKISLKSAMALFISEGPEPAFSRAPPEPKLNVKCLTSAFEKCAHLINLGHMLVFPYPEISRQRAKKQGLAWRFLIFLKFFFC